MSKKQWIDWPHDECPECGSDIQILTDAEQEPGVPVVWSGDTWRCDEGHVGGVYCDSETPVQIEWNGQTTKDMALPD